MSKRANNLQETNYPLVSVQRFQSLKCDVNTRQVEELARYVSYVESIKDSISTHLLARNNSRTTLNSAKEKQVEERTETKAKGQRVRVP
jgi:hypothetical protein